MARKKNRIIALYIALSMYIIILYYIIIIITIVAIWNVTLTIELKNFIYITIHIVEDNYLNLWNK